MMRRFAIAVTAMIITGSAGAGAPANDGETIAVPGFTVAEAKTDSANWRAVDPENLLIFETTKGRILIEIFPEVAPAHAKQFRAIVRSGDYDGTSFHRVIDGFMAQGGDIFQLKGRESGLPDIPGEFTFRRKPADMPLDISIGPIDSAREGYIRGFPIHTQARFLSEMTVNGDVETWIPHCRGIVSTARTSDPNSANSQFFLMRDYSPHLDKQYTAWGRILEGEDVVLKLKTGEPVRNPDILTKARVAADLPVADRPKVWVLRTDGPMFAESIQAVGETPVCELTSVPSVVEN